MTNLENFFGFEIFCLTLCESCGYNDDAAIEEDVERNGVGESVKRISTKSGEKSRDSRAYFRLKG